MLLLLSMVAIMICNQFSKKPSLVDIAKKCAPGATFSRSFLGVPTLVEEQEGIVLYCIVLYCTVLYCIVLYCIVLYCIVLYCIVSYCVMSCCIKSYPTLLHCTVLYHVMSVRLGSTSTSHKAG